MTNEQQELDENKLIGQRRDKLARLRESDNAFPNDFRRDALAGELQARYADSSAEQLEAEPVRVAIAGRMMAKRIMGKASFSHIQDMSGRIQLFLRGADLPEGVYDDFKTWDVGDIVAAEGVLMRTKAGELSVKVEQLRLLTKSLRPLPEKWHGIVDQETRYRQRYVDLIVTEEARRTFIFRSRIVQYIREFLNKKGFLEVETPMMQPIPGGATARPFTTHHNALDTKLYLRVAPELYLKRLVVGGFEKVYEINRNFRNEGVSTRHNPEFTMLEFYQAYADHQMLMDLTEELLRGLARDIVGSEQISYQGETFDFGKPFERVSVFDAILQHNPEIRRDDLSSLDATRQLCERLNIPVKDGYGLGRLQLEVFEKTTEHKLRDPTFVIDYPKEVSPLARAKDADPFLTDRFELFIGGREIANGFSELNDPEDQAERFRQQAAEKAAGDLEAMYYDADYIRALEYGLPPTAGEGIGIDRLVMLLTDSASIRDVLLFPAMRPETK